MAVSNSQVKQEIKTKMMEHLKSKLQVQTASFDMGKGIERNMQRDGTDNVDDYIKNLTGDLMGQAGVDLKQTLTSTVFQPVLLDPDVHDQGTLYNITPFLTYLENKGRRTPAGSTKEDYIQLTQGFVPEWIGETAATVGSGTPAVNNAHAVVYVEALPMSFSDLLAFGQGATSKAQLMQFAQEALREGFNQAIISGSNANQPNQMDGIFTICANQTGALPSYRMNKSGAEVTVDDMNQLDAGLTDVNKGYATFALSTRTVLNQIKKDMQDILHLNMPQYNVTAGVNVPAYTGPNGDIPIISDSQVPNTAGGRHLGLFNERHIFIKDIINNAWVEKGRTMPIATEGWLVQVSMMYHVAPPLMAELYNIA
jgi:hypothetical protein